MLSGIPRRETGGKCGSTFIDRNFIAWMTQNFGDAFTSVPRNRRGPGSSFMNAFETAKKNFGSPDAASPAIEIGPIRMNAPDSDCYDRDERMVLLPRYERVLRGL
jgi:hypothetical protein